MCVKLPLRDLNPDIYPPHPTSTYTCGVTIAPRVCGGNYDLGCVWLGVKYFPSVKYFRERKIFSSVGLHYENCSRKCFHMFGCILKILFSY